MTRLWREHRTDNRTPVWVRPTGALTKNICLPCPIDQTLALKLAYLRDDHAFCVPIAPISGAQTHGKQSTQLSGSGLPRADRPEPSRRHQKVRHVPPTLTAQVQNTFSLSTTEVDRSIATVGVRFTSVVRQGSLVAVGYALCEERGFVLGTRLCFGNKQLPRWVNGFPMRGTPVPSRA